jgi:hypothetical protein
MTGMEIVAVGVVVAFFGGIAYVRWALKKDANR